MLNWFKKAGAPAAQTISLADHEAECARLQRTIDEITEDANLWRTQSYEADLRIAELEAELAGLKDRLNHIAAQATPGANATVKRMAAIARGDVPAQS